MKTILFNNLILASAILLLVGAVQNTDAVEVGRVESIEGVNLVRSSDAKEFKRLERSDQVSLNDTIKTEKSSKVWIKLKDLSDHSLGEFSELYVYDFDVQDKSTFYAADISGGIVRFRKRLGKTDPPSSYTISTPTAMIQVLPEERPADFVVNVYSRKKTSVTVIWGKVSVKNLKDDLPGERIVESCRKVDIEEDQAPTRPVGVSSKTLSQLISRTTIKGTLPEEVPQCSEGYVQRSRCRDCEVLDGERCVGCEELGLRCEHGRCIPQECGDCRILWGNRCVPCRELGLVCLGGECVSRTCPGCSVWDGRRCVPCRSLGLECISGRCDRGACPPCTSWDGLRCVPCAEMGLMCIGGRCIFRPCGPCETRRGDRCISCGELGLVCVDGRCVMPLIFPHDARPGHVEQAPIPPGGVVPHPPIVTPGAPGKPLLPPGVLPVKPVAPAQPGTPHQEPPKPMTPKPDAPSVPPKHPLPVNPGDVHKPDVPKPGSPPDKLTPSDVVKPHNPSQDMPGHDLIKPQDPGPKPTPGVGSEHPKPISKPEVRPQVKPPVGLDGPRQEKTPAGRDAPQRKPEAIREIPPSNPMQNPHDKDKR
jgi:hypothetical protein